MQQTVVVSSHLHLIINQCQYVQHEVHGGVHTCAKDIFEEHKILRFTIVYENVSLGVHVPRFLFVEALFDNIIEATNFFKYLKKRLA